MKQLVNYVFITVLFFSFSCAGAKENDGRTKVIVKTEFGDIKIELYDETPLHRDNFIKLAEEGFFDGLLFHRVIENFMIQGGDPDSKNAKPGKRLGGGGPDYKIPAEFNPNFFHRKGALAAARESDQVNPEKKSSGSQFYIVQGEVFSRGKLDTIEMKMNQGLQQQIMRKCFSEAKDTLTKFRKEGNEEGFNLFVADLREKADSAFQNADKKVIPAERKEVYSTVGGYPSLDENYTVFGQVVEGLEVIDKIAAVETDKANRPLQDVKMEIEVIK